MIRSLLPVLIFSALTSFASSSEPVSKEPLLMPPEDATRYVIVSGTNKAPLVSLV